MSAHGFSTDQRREWTIWAAKLELCSKCGARDGTPCVSLADLNNRDEARKQNPRINRWPHDPRINWDRLLNGLKQRGYYHPTIEDQVRKMREPRDGSVHLQDEAIQAPEEGAQEADQEWVGWSPPYGAPDGEDQDPDRLRVNSPPSWAR